MIETNTVLQTIYKKKFSCCCIWFNLLWTQLVVTELWSLDLVCTKSFGTRKKIYCSRCETCTKYIWCILMIRSIFRYFCIACHTVILMNKWDNPTENTKNYTKKLNLTLKVIVLPKLFWRKTKSKKTYFLAFLLLFHVVWA